MWNATLAELLVDHGADIHRKVEVPGQGSLTLLELAREKQDITMIELLLERGTGAPKSMDEDKLPIPSKPNPFMSLIMSVEYYALKWASPVGDIEATTKDQSQNSAFRNRVYSVALDGPAADTETKEILKISDDHSFFAWQSKDDRGGLLATGPEAFASSSDIVPRCNDVSDSRDGPITVSSLALHIVLSIVGTFPSSWLVLSSMDGPRNMPGIPAPFLPNSGHVC
ncbi:hypothetical protein B0T25DRAFT_571973 [Lasiosphaeria hispida]|uniref:Ankyrin repeat protein n=1 Tax=Lasiosphaeria hispida TaxID=260671 RepID=A0AAJ0HC46_9PEZI|nr:hypothetical protein B0T25DRAFT_571973 [Lasiosphaeria hispida]